MKLFKLLFFLITVSLVYLNCSEDENKSKNANQVTNNAINSEKKIVRISDQLATEHAVIHGAEATSEKKMKDGSILSADRLFDRDIHKAWCEGKYDAGIDESITFALKDFTKIKIIYIYNGFAGNEDDYFNHNRAKIFEIIYPDGKSQEITIPDERKLHKIDLKNEIETNTITLKIKDIYKGKDNDTGISEISFNEPPNVQMPISALEKYTDKYYYLEESRGGFIIFKNDGNYKYDAGKFNGELYREEGTFYIKNNTIELKYRSLIKRIDNTRAYFEYGTRLVDLNIINSTKFCLEDTLMNESECFDNRIPKDYGERNKWSSLSEDIENINDTAVNDYGTPIDKTNTGIYDDINTTTTDDKNDLNKPAIKDDQLNEIEDIIKSYDNEAIKEDIYDHKVSPSDNNSDNNSTTEPNNPDE